MLQSYLQNLKLRKARRCSSVISAPLYKELFCYYWLFGEGLNLTHRFSRKTDGAKNLSSTIPSGEQIKHEVELQVIQKIFVCKGQILPQGQFNKSLERGVFFPQLGSESDRLFLSFTECFWLLRTWIKNRKSLAMNCKHSQFYQCLLIHLLWCSC